jgi:hypothetical protein
MAGKDDLFSKIVDRAFEIGGEIITDARHELIERGWFGRAVNIAADVQEFAKGPVVFGLEVAFSPTETAAPEFDELRGGCGAGNWNALCDSLSQERGVQPDNEPAQDPGQDLDR